MAIAVPTIREGIVERTALVKQLVDSSGTRVVLILASAGYGKSTLLAQWAAADDRPFAWLSVGPELRDPIVLLGEVADAFASIEPLDRGARPRITTPDVDFTSVRLPRLAHIAAGRTTPFVLVIDDVHLLSSPQAWAALDVLCTSVPEGSQIAFATRAEPGINVGGLRAMGDLLTIDGEHLAMTDDEGAALLSAAGLDLADDDASLLVEHTEGWPVALYLAALALRGADDPGAAARAFAGDDRYVVDYLRDELFGALSVETEQFLTRTSVLDRMSGSLCDAVLDRTGSGGVLQSLEASNLLLIPLDRTREWYRVPPSARRRALDPPAAIGARA